MAKEGKGKKEVILVDIERLSNLANKKMSDYVLKNKKEVVLAAKKISLGYKLPAIGVEQTTALTRLLYNLPKSKDYHIHSGHNSLVAARLLGLKTVPVFVCRDSYFSHLPEVIWANKNIANPIPLKILDKESTNKKEKEEIIGAWIKRNSGSWLNER
jgi:hypothetical protein